jgi:glutaconate CoA-transferase subunit A
MNAIVLPRWVVAAIACVPGGAHPSYAHGYYSRDNAFYLAWDDISRDRARFAAWIDRHVRGTSDHAGFLRSIRAAEA